MPITRPILYSMLCALSVTGVSLYNTALLRIDTGGLSFICCALFNEVPTQCSLANYHTLYVIK